MTDKEYDVLQYINSHGISRTEILSSDLHLSESTVRRILDKLEQRELIVRFHGGASPASTEQRSAVHARFHTQTDEKERIAKTASELLSDGNIVILLGGTTVAGLCKYFRRKRLTVITNSILVFDRMKDNPTTKMVLLGGEYCQEENELKGSLTNNMLLQLGADYLFSGASAFDERRGFLTNEIDSIELYNSCFQAAKNVVMMVDSSKYNANAIAVTASCGKVNYLVSGRELCPDAVKAFQENGIQVLSA